MTERLLPVTTDRDTGPFFAAAREGRLVYRGCKACGRGYHPPTPSCCHCGSAEVEWREARGRGQAYTWTVVTRTMHPAYPAPYTIVAVALEEAPDVRLIARLEGEVALAPGQPMELVFEEVSPAAVLPNWRLAEPGGPGSRPDR